MIHVTGSLVGRAAAGMHLADRPVRYKPNGESGKRHRWQEAGPAMFNRAMGLATVVGLLHEMRRCDPIPRDDNFGVPPLQMQT